MSSRILLADDEAIFLSATARALGREGYQCDTALSAARCCALLSQQRYDVLLADTHMPGNSDLELMTSVGELPRPPAVILMSGKPSLPSVIKALKFPVSAYLVKPFSMGELLREIEEAIAGRQRVLPVAVPPSAPPEELDQVKLQLSMREVEVITRLLRGQGAAQIAGTLSISSNTVRNHIKNIYRKLGVHSRSALMQRFGAHSLDRVL